MFFLKINQYGDFDILQTKEVLYTTEPFNIVELLTEFKNKYNVKGHIDDRGIRGIHYSDCIKTTDKFITFLTKKKQFKILKFENEIVFSD